MEINNTPIKCYVAESVLLLYNYIVINKILG